MTAPKCEITCSKGFADTTDGFCRCCEFVEYPKFTDLRKQLDDLIAEFDSTGSADALIDARIQAIEDKLQAINDYVLENCGAPLSAAISAQFVIIGGDIKQLGVSVEEFKISLVPNSSCDSKPPCSARLPQRKYTDCSCFCPVICNATADFVTLRDICACQYFEGYSDLIELRTQIQRIITEVSYSFWNTETASTIIKELTTELTNVNVGISGFENRWSTTTLEQKQITMETIITRASGVLETANTFIISGPCGKTCTRPRVNKATDCTCYVTKPISDFFRSFASFSSIETQIRGYNFRGNTTTQKYFTEWAARIRAEGAEFYRKVTESVFDIPTQTILVNNFINHANELSAAWKAFTLGLVVTTTKCNVACSGDSIKNCGTCSCAPIQQWTELNTDVLNGLPGITADIESLAIDESDKITLRKNVKTISDGIVGLKQYVIDFCGNLDEKYVQLLCLELVGFYNKLKSDIAAIENPTFVKICTISCPNSLWVYDADACKCSCSIKNCVVGSETFDPYNCICAKKTTCALTTSSCTGLTPLLDYSNCVCKKNPSP